MAPEQITGEPVDARTDQYALAGTLVRMLTNAPLFTATNAASLIHAHLSVTPPSLERLEGLDANVAKAIARALSKKKADRFPDMKSFAAALGGAAPASAQARAHVPANPLEPTLKASAHPPRPASNMREIELDDAAASSNALELDAKPVPDARPSSKDAPIGLRTDVPALPLPPPPASLAQQVQEALARDEHRGGPLAVLRGVPFGVWKRVAAYSALVLVLGNACFRGSITFSIAFGLCIAVGALGMFAHGKRAPED
jgi:serine/threonine-protein kinase